MHNHSNITVVNKFVSFPHETCIELSLLKMVALEQLFKEIKFVYLYGTNAKQLNISTNQNKRKFLTTYLDPSFLVFSIHGKIRGKDGYPI